MEVNAGDFVTVQENLNWNLPKTFLAWREFGKDMKTVIILVNRTKYFPYMGSNQPVREVENIKSSELYDNIMKEQSLSINKHKNRTSETKYEIITRYTPLTKKVKW